MSNYNQREGFIVQKIYPSSFLTISNDNRPNRNLTKKMMESPTSTISEHISNDNLHTKNEQNSKHDLLCYLLPLYNMLNWLYFAPARFKYDQEQKFYNISHSFILKKVLVILAQMCGILWILGTVHKYSSSITAVTSGITYKINYILLLPIMTTFYWLLDIKGNETLNFFKQIESVTIQLHKLCHDSKKIISSQSALRTCWTLIILYLLAALIFTIVFEIMHGDWSYLASFEAFIQQNVNEATLSFYGPEGSAFNNYDYDNTTESPTNNNSFPVGNDHYESEGMTFLNLLIATVYFFMTFYATCTWALSFLLILVWEILFYQLFKILFNCIETNQKETKMQWQQRQESQEIKINDGFGGHNDFLLKYIQIFNQITCLLEEFNNTFGLNIFFNVLGCSYFLAINFTAFIDPELNRGAIFNVIMSICILMLCFDLMVASEIHHMCNKMGLLIKQSVNNTNTNNQNHNNKNRLMDFNIIQGINSIHYDLLSNTIGIKGYGFFTITYSFVGTLLSVVTTYAVLIQQFQKTATE